MDAKTIKRFWAKVSCGSVLGNIGGCWEWLGYRNANGYGRFCVNGKPELAHRVSWQIHFGEIPKRDDYHGWCVCHACDNPACVNPAHLFLGSHSDNMKDRCDKGLRPCGYADWPRGSAHPGAKLTEDQVREIRANDGRLSHQKLAAVYGVCRAHIGLIMNRKTWTHI